MTIGILTTLVHRNTIITSLPFTDRLLFVVICFYLNVVDIPTSEEKFYKIYCNEIHMKLLGKLAKNREFPIHNRNLINFKFTCKFNQVQVHL